MDSINIRQLAVELNLSVGTVSKALKDSYEISAETKRRVTEMALRLNYIPNPYASSLRRRKSKTIAVVIPEVADSFFSLAINGIDAVARNKGYHVLIYLTHESFEREQTILNECKSGRIDGLLISVTKETTDYQHICDLQQNGVPIVVFDRVAEDVNIAKVTTNDFESGYLAASHLIEKGCKRIAYLSLSKNLSITNQRMEGYRQALVNYSIAMNENDTVFCTMDDAGNQQLIEDLLSRSNHPDGIIISVEKLILPVYDACHNLNLSIPSKVKVISFCNLPSARILNPSLTTITQPAFEMGETAAELLFKGLEKRNFILKEESMTIPSILNERESTL